MKVHIVPITLFLLVLASLSGVSSPVIAQDEYMEEIVTIGSRNFRPRSADDSPVPIDVITDEEFDSLGGTADITDNLRALIPSYTATPATGDGSAFIRPTSLRGTAADQTLVLVDGKRRHRSALVQFLAPAAGAGAHAVDIGMIPAIAIERVEVLRDGAASQYGSDAIAGVINFVTKSADEGGELQVQFGEYFDGEQSVRVSGNIGSTVGDGNFVNASFEYIDNDALSRGLQRPDAQVLIDSGVPGVGADAPFDDSPFVQTWGRPETSGTRVFVNSGFALGDQSDLYARFGYADTEGRYRFFFRHPTTHSTFTTPIPAGEDFSPLMPSCPVCAPGESLSLRDQGFSGLPAGFTPFLDGDQTDISFVIGVEGEYESSLRYDYSFGYGRNELDYFLNNTANYSLGPGDFTNLPQMNFDVGGYEQEEVNVNADFSLPISDQLHLAFGAEWREETYTAIAGEPSSFFGAGASGLKGVTTEDAGGISRDNIAVYADIEHDVSDALFLQYALRFEDFSDFGDTINGKIAARLRLNDNFVIRGAVSTGFHAPTPGQATVRTTITTADSTIGGTPILVEEGLFPPTHPAAVAVGGTALQEETSLNISAGFTANLFDTLTLTVDGYQIDVDDRIYKTGNIPDPSTGGSIAFFTNAIDVEHTGFDVVLTADTEWGDTANTSWSLAYSRNEVEVVGQSPVNSPSGPVLPVGDANIENIENNFPNDRFVLSANTYFGEKVNVLIRANYYGDHLDERGRIGDPTNLKARVGSTVYVDLDIGIHLNENWRVNIGGVNVTDEFIDEIGPPFANRLSVGLQYPRRSAANYEGGSWYIRGTYMF